VNLAEVGEMTSFGERGDVYYKDESKYPPRVMVWGAISERGKTPLYILHGTLDAPKYIQVLEGALPFMAKPFTTRRRHRDWWFLQDLDSKATAKATQVWCEQHFPHFIPAGDYPPRSPELNAIEHIWGWMQARVEAAKLTGRRELERFLVKLWNDVPQRVIRNCIASIPERLQSVIAAKGGTIPAE
jgi:inhibitor of nuclear factor kappa-B kinase subunit alpha